MARNYKNEALWKKSKYEKIVADVDKELGIAFKEKLKSKNITIAGWLTDAIKEFMKKN